MNVELGNCLAVKRVIPLALLLVALSIAPVLAEEPTDVEKLRATVERLQKTVEELQQRIIELEKQSAVPESPAEPIAAAPTETLLVPDYNTVADQQPAAPRPDNVPLDPSLKGFIPIPGTGSMFKIGGSARVDAIYDDGDNGNPNWFNPSSMPVDGQPGAEGGERTALHGKGTRMNLELRRNLGTKDELRIFYENDFFGDSSSSTMTYRLRHLYGQASNFLVGQTYSAFENIDSWPDVVDNLGPNAIVNRRQAQIRYTRPISRGSDETQSAYFSVEMPSTEIDTGVEGFPGGSRTVNRLPDFVAGYRLEKKAGHLQFAALGRSLTVEQTGGARDSVTGWGLNFSGAINVFGGDRISYQVVYGEGVARYLNDTNGLDLDAGLDDVGELQAIPIVAPVIGYLHEWNETWRSTVVYSYVRVDAPVSKGPEVIDTDQYASVNLIYQPTKAFRLGLEYLHGTKETADGARGDADRLDFVVKYDLVK